MKLHCTFSIDAANPSFAVPLKMVPDIHSQPAREMKINLKERFGIFVTKEKFHPRWGSPQPLNLKSNTLVHCATGASCPERITILSFIFLSYKHHFLFPFSLIFDSCWSMKRRGHIQI